MNYPKEGITVDAAHSMKNGVTEYQAIDLKTGERLFYKNIGNQTTNIGEYLGLMETIKYVIENDFQPRIVYTDSMTAITWFRNKKTASKKRHADLQRSEIFLKVMDFDISSIDVRHWNTSEWGENPADFGNK